MILSQVVKWGNSQGVRIPRRLLRGAGIDVNDNVAIIAKNNAIIIKLADRKTLSWYLEGYDNDGDRYDWGETDRPEGRELL
jgi:antitoxin MazE